MRIVETLGVYNEFLNQVKRVIIGMGLLDKIDCDKA